MEKIMEFLSVKKNKRRIMFILLAILAIFIIIFIITTSVKAKNKAKCNNLRNEIIKIADDYLTSKNLFPTLNGTSISIDLSNLEDIVYKDEYVKGSITYTKYNDSYVKTLNISNASNCDTKEFGKETSEYKDNENAKVNVTFNYYEVDSYNSKWTNYIASEYISEEETDGVLLPIDQKKLPSIPRNAVITEYVRETKTYYSYRDKKWRYYRNNIKYSEYSATQPNGYTYKDTATKSTTEPSEWSLDYPEVFEYRHIKSTAGYRWYYLDNNKKVYWENGKYSPNSPGENYTKDTENKATMYSYYDDIYRWYNGSTTRVYSPYYSEKPKSYNYKDEDTLTYTNWSSYTDESYLNESNKSYREEVTDIYSRYLIKYDIYSLPMLSKNVSLQELEQTLGKSYEEINNDESIKVEVHFTFQYE